MLVHISPACLSNRIISNRYKIAIKFILWYDKKKHVIIMNINVLHTTKNKNIGFTLIELSIVLVIIGLIIGGVLLGNDLINAAAIRSQISQIEKYQTAVRTFQGKYGYLPGDIPDPTATQFGFLARGTNQGEGDGNGILENSSGGGCNVVGNCGNSFSPLAGELMLFWADLSQTGLIEGNFTTYASATIPPLFFC